MSLPNITLIGNVVADAELRFTNAGKAWTTFRVACNDRRKNEAGEWIDGKTTFVDVTTWRAAEAVATALKKGTKVLVVGDLNQLEFETKSGEKRTGYKVVANEVATLIYDRTGQVSGTQSVTAGDPWTSSTTSSASDEAPF